MRRRPADPETAVQIGWPVVPHGISVSMTVKLSQLQDATERLLAWARENNDMWARLPTSGPEVIPGGTPVQAWSDYDESSDRGKCGFRK